MSILNFWHDPSEKPNEKQEILVEWEGYAGTLYHDVGMYDFDAFYFSNMPAKKLSSVKRWGYIEDLL